MNGFATSFADPKDVERFKACKGHGLSDRTCFRVGDNAIGCWGDSTAEGTGPSCAVPPEQMRAKWGSMQNAKHKPIRVIHGDKSVVCVLKDTMPSESHITNSAIIDLNPDACKALGLTPPVKSLVSWQWA